MKIPNEIWLCIAFFTYYTILQVYSDISRYSMRTYTKSRTIEQFRSKYNVTVRTFHSSSPLYGFAWRRSIWVNDNLLKLGKPLEYTLHHEYYHLKHRHKLWKMFMRLVISISPLTIYFVTWWGWVVILLFLASLSEKVSGIFENRANDYAAKMIK